ncbi:MAG TPA: SDR family oxidoreductase [Candidatus Thermoplasmatota archaeon]|nr:SDR family oxidoreductase [Candidatus Thermoplasmatota archaeon]
MERILQGKAALVTGGGRGIGRAVAEAFSQAGAGVVVFSRTLREVEETAKAIEAAGGRAVAVAGDVREPKDLEAAVEAAHAAFGRLDILVADAGANVISKRLIDASEQEWDDAFDVNVKGSFLTVRAAAPRMSKDGSIILVTTGLARGPGRFGAFREDGHSDPDGPLPEYAPYSLAKYAVEGLTRVLAAELPQRVNCVNPGVVDTRMSPGVPLKPHDVTGVFLHLASKESGSTTGRVLRALDFLADP